MSNLSSQLLVLVRNLLVEVRTLSFNLLRLQENVAAISEQNAAEKKANEKPCEFPSRIAADVNFESKVVNRYYANYHKPNSLQWATFGITVLTLIAVVVYAIVAYLQHRDLLDSNRINRESLVSVQRAFLTCGEVTGWRHMANEQSGSYVMWDFSVPCENAGTTPANVVAQAFFADALPNEPSEEQFTRKPLIQTAIVGPKIVHSFGDFHTTELEFFGRELPRKLSDILAMQVQTVAPPAKRHFFWGWISYHDVFPKTDLHITEFCQMQVAFSLRRTDPKNPFVLRWGSCSRHNCADKHCDDYENIKKLSEEAP